MKVIITTVLLSAALSGCIATVSFPTSATMSVTPASYSKEDCKKGGWQTLRRSDGSSFRNQGDCVSYFKK
jgi:hypothetical protein